MQDLQDKFTKNVATIGPAADTEEDLEKMVEAGMNVARFNTKHSTPEWHQERIARVKRVARKLNKPIATLLDLQGPEIRIDLPQEKSFEVKIDDIVHFTFNPKLDRKNLILIPKNVVQTVSVDNLILIDDGFCEFVVTNKGKEYLEAKTLNDATVKHRKTMNIPGITIDMPSLIEADYAQLDGIKEDLVDFVALSFVRSREDIDFLRDELKKRNVTAGIVAKIETQAALDNLEEIVDVSDAVMVARGDLGVEMPMEEMVYWQKIIVNMCRAKGKPVITATQMLKSMVDFPRPTRAEVSDVAHAVYGCTSAVMLSEETTIGAFPVKAVKTQAKIALFNEKKVIDTFDFDDMDLDGRTSFIARSVVKLLENVPSAAKVIVCLTATGRSANIIASLRPRVPIVAVTHNQDTYYRLALSYAVSPQLVDSEVIGENNIKEILAHLKERGVLRSGQKVVTVAGDTPLVPGFTNTMGFHVVK